MMTNIIYDKTTCEVKVVEMNGIWITPATWEVAHFGDGFEPVLENINGRVFIRPTALIVRPSEMKGEE